MAHLIETMAYAGSAPWHGLGNQLTQKQPIEVWQREAGMNWAIQESSVLFKSEIIGRLGAIHPFLTFNRAQQFQVSQSETPLCS